MVSPSRLRLLNSTRTALTQYCVSALTYVYQLLLLDLTNFCIMEMSYLSLSPITANTLVHNVL